MRVLTSAKASGIREKITPLMPEGKSARAAAVRSRPGRLPAAAVKRTGCTTSAPSSRTNPEFGWPACRPGISLRQDHRVINKYQHRYHSSTTTSEMIYRKQIRPVTCTALTPWIGSSQVGRTLSLVSQHRPRAGLIWVVCLLSCRRQVNTDPGVASEFDPSSRPGGISRPASADAVVMGRALNSVLRVRRGARSSAPPRRT